VINRLSTVTGKRWAWAKLTETERDKYTGVGAIGYSDHKNGYATIEVSYILKDGKAETKPYQMKTDHLEVELNEVERDFKLKSNQSP
jgi:hypothetical protein